MEIPANTRKRSPGDADLLGWHSLEAVSARDESRGSRSFDLISGIRLLEVLREDLRCGQVGGGGWRPCLAWRSSGHRRPRPRSNWNTNIPEGQPLKYKTTSKTSQVLTIAGQGDRDASQIKP